MLEFDTNPEDSSKISQYPEKIESSRQKLANQFYIAALTENLAKEQEKKSRPTLSYEIDKGTAIGPLQFELIEFRAARTKGTNATFLYEIRPKKGKNLFYGDLNDKKENQVSIHQYLKKDETTHEAETTSKIIKLHPPHSLTLEVKAKERLESTPTFYLKKETKFRDSTSKALKNILQEPNRFWPPAQLPELQIEPVDDEKQFTQAISPDDPSFLEAFRMCTTNNQFCGVKGPPGTGKTTLLATVALYLAYKEKKVIIISNSNSAVENAIRKIKENQEKIKLDFNPIIAKKTSDDKNCPQDLQLYGIKFFEDWNAVKNNIHPIMGSTMMSSHSISKLETKFDYLLYDEASQSMAYNIASIAEHFKNIVLFGDEKQLEPIILAEQADLLDSGKSAMGFLEARYPDRTKTLLHNHRSNQPCVNYTQQVYYPEDNIIAVTNKTACLVTRNEKQLPKVTIQSKEYLIPTSGNHFINVESNHNKKRNIQEVQACCEIIKTLLKLDYQLNGEKKAYPIKAEDIAVLTPHKQQAQQIISALVDQNILTTQEIEDELTCGTVHRLQGTGKPVVIYSMTASNLTYVENNPEFLFNPRLANVASSRAICACYILGSLNTLQNAEPNHLQGITLKENVLENLEKIILNPIQA